MKVYDAKVSFKIIPHFTLILLNFIEFSIECRCRRRQNKRIRKKSLFLLFLWFSFFFSIQNETQCLYSKLYLNQLKCIKAQGKEKKQQKKSQKIYMENVLCEKEDDFSRGFTLDEFSFVFLVCKITQPKKYKIE